MRGSCLAIGVVLVITVARVDGRGASQTTQVREELGTSLGSVSAVAEAEDVCCSDYLATIVAQIRRHWSPPPAGMTAATAGVTFSIASDGRISEVSLEKRSGNGLLDMGALHAIQAVAVSRQLPPLPASFRHLALVVRVAFEYGRPKEPNKFGPEIQFDTRGVEFGTWIRHFMAAIKSHWIVPASALSSGHHVAVTFSVNRDGFISNVTVSTPSFFEAFNRAASNAIFASSPTEPLPREYPRESAFFTVNFFCNDKPPQGR